MISENMERKLSKVFKTINFKISKSGELSVNEFRIGDVEIVFRNNVNQVQIPVTAKFEKNLAQKIYKNKFFFKTLKQEFVIMDKLVFEKNAVEKDRRILVFKVLQVESCNI